MHTRVALRSMLLPGVLALVSFTPGSDAPVTAQQRPLAYDVLASPEQVEALGRALSDRLPYVPGEALVKFRDGTGSAAQVRALSAVRGGIGRRDARWIGDVLWVRAGDEADAEHLSAALQRQPEVEWAQPNYLRHGNPAPNDPSYPSRQWNFDLIDMPRAWDINAGSSESMTIAIIDSGITTVTETFRFPLWTGTRFESVEMPFRVNPDISPARILPGRDFIFWDGPVLDMDGHGTHVAGTALEETNNSVALSGIAYRAKLMPLKVCVGYWEIRILLAASGIPGPIDPESGGCSDAAITQAIRYAADNGATILNLSLGGPGRAPAQRDAIQYAVGRGAFVSMSAGNDFREGNPVEYPGAYAAEIDGAMVVGAVGRLSQRAAYSATGPHLEIAAPGGNPADGNPSGYIWQNTLFGPDRDPFTVARPRFDRYAESGYAGTSMAAPHVAGLAALLSAQGIIRPAAIEAAIKRFATDLGTAGRDDEFGHGLINARTSLRGLGVAR